MRSTCSLYVDTGYLLAAAASRVTGTSLRSGIHVDYATLISALIRMAESRSGLPVLRVHWYDSARNGIPDVQQERIGELSKVKLRLGRFGVNGEQKGVDLRIGLDLVAHARNEAADVFFLVSGDDDLTEAVEEAQVHGVQVVVLAVPTTRDTPHGVSRHLLRAADELETIEGDTIDRVVTKIDRRPASSPPAQPVEPPTPPEPATNTVEASSRPSRPTPLDLAAGPRPGSQVKTSEPRSAPVPAYSSSTGQTAWIAPGFDNDQHPPAALPNGELIAEVVTQVLASFRASTTPEGLAGLERARPSIPPEIDRALLRDASDAMQIDDLDETVRHRLRARFWQQFDAGTA